MIEGLGVYALPGRGGGEGLQMCRIMEVVWW
jgi:hypothetical protein